MGDRLGPDRDRLDALLGALYDKVEEDLLPGEGLAYDATAQWERLSQHLGTINHEVSNAETKTRDGGIEEIVDGPQTRAYILRTSAIRVGGVMSTAVTLDSSANVIAHSGLSHTVGVFGLRELAQAGTLAAAYAAGSRDLRIALRIGAFELVAPVVFQRLTRLRENRRGHRLCASSIDRLEPGCLDSFHDDVEAVVEDLLRNAHAPIFNLEGWVGRRLMAVTVDGYRRRRGERGALQRPRIPRWLAQELRHDERLMQLAIKMLEWVGVDATAGLNEWPVEAWSDMRTEHGVDYVAARRSVEQDIATVIVAMRKRARWYETYVERPMGRKQLPIAPIQQQGILEALPGPGTEVLALHAAADDVRLTELAALAVEMIGARVARGEDLRSTVVEVISSIFGSGSGSENLDRIPGHDPSDDQALPARLSDPATVDQIVAVVIELISR